MFVKKRNFENISNLIDSHLSSGSNSDFSRGFLHCLEIVLSEFSSGGVRSATVLLRYLKEEQQKINESLKAKKNGGC